MDTQNVRFFKELIESRRNSELAFLANRDMMEQHWNKPLLLLLVTDIKKVRDEAIQIASRCQEQ